MSTVPETLARPAPWFRRAYVALMMAVIGRSLVAMSHVDPKVRDELAPIAPGFVFRMTVLPDGPSFAVERTGGGVFALVKDDTRRADLTVIFKHLRHAFLVFSFQEGTARAFANDRMFVDGQVSVAVRIVRVLDRMEAVILPKLVARRALKRYPRIALADKLALAAKAYGVTVLNLLRGR
jgi:hypothetical protein